MTIKLGLSWGQIGIQGTGGDYVSLVYGDDGFHLLDWQQEIAGDTEDAVVEVLTVAVEGDDHDDIATNVLQPLDKMIDHLQDFKRDSANIRAVRLIHKLDNQSEQQWSTVLGLKYRFNVALNRPPMSPGNYVEQYTISITREAHWDSGRGTGDGSGRLYGAAGDLTTGAVHNLIFNYGDDSGLSAWNDVPGTDPARLLYVAVNADNGGPMTEAWVAFRSDKYGDRTKWEPVWNLTEASYIDSGDTSEVSDGDAFTGTCLEVNPTDTTLTTRAIITLNDVIGSQTFPLWLAQRGTFLVLLRARATGTRTYRVEIAQGFWGGSGDSGSWSSQRSLKVSGTSWYLFPSGYVSLPPERYMEALASNYSILINSGVRIRAAELATGTGNLRLDVAIMFPTNEGLIHLAGCDMTTTETAYAYQEPDGSWTTYNLNGSGVVTQMPIVSPINPQVPLGPGSFLVIGQRSSSHELTDRAYVFLRYATLFRSLRGDAGP